MENRDHSRSPVGGFVGLLSMFVVTAGAVLASLDGEKGKPDAVTGGPPAADVPGDGKVPEWFRRTALWYGEGRVSEREFLDAITYLVDNGVIILDRNPE